jgi:hypothetical protein
MLKQAGIGFCGPSRSSASSSPWNPLFATCNVALRIRIGNTKVILLSQASQAGS